MRSHIGPSVQLSAVIVRRCQNPKCNAPREFGKPCANCHNTLPPDVVDLGVIASHQKNRWTRLKWNLWGFRAAQRKIRKANREMIENGSR